MKYIYLKYCHLYGPSFIHSTNIWLYFFWINVVQIIWKIYILQIESYYDFYFSMFLLKSLNVSISATIFIISISFRESSVAHGLILPRIRKQMFLIYLRMQFIYLANFGQLNKLVSCNINRLDIMFLMFTYGNYCCFSKRQSSS